MDQQRFKKSNRDKSPRGRLLIQHYIYDLQARSGGESRQLPSSRELAAQFGVSRCTVTRELEKLVRDGVLVTKQGIGTFLAPAPEKAGFRKKRIIGLLFGSGANYCYGEYDWGLLALTGSILIERHCLVRPLNISSGDKEGFVQELCENFLDGLIWFSLPEERIPVAERICREIPTVVFGPFHPAGCNSIMVDYVEESYREGKLLLQEGRHSFWGIQNDDPGAKLYLQGYRKAFEEAGKQFDSDMIFSAVTELPEQLRQALQAGKRPDVFLIHSPDLREKTIRLLQEFHIDFQKQCRLICGNAAMKIHGFAGWCHEQPYQEIGEVAVEMLLRQLNGDDHIEQKKLATRRIIVNLEQEKSA